MSDNEEQKTNDSVESTSIPVHQPHNFVTGDDESDDVIEVSPSQEKATAPDVNVGDQPEVAEVYVDNQLKTPPKRINDATAVMPNARLSKEVRNQIYRELREPLVKEYKALKEEYDNTPKESVDALSKLSAKLTELEEQDERLKAHWVDEMGQFTFDYKEYESTFDQPDAEWAQSLEGENGKPIRLGHPRFTINKEDSKLEGNNALRYLSSKMGVSNVTRVPCWHSGLILTLDSFRERDLLDLDLRLQQQLMDLGNMTKGISYTGDDVYVVGTIMDFILKHVTDCNLKEFTVETLRKLILVNDYPGILAGALAGIYPSGYPVIHECIGTATNKCDYLFTAKKDEFDNFIPDGMLDFKKTWWVNKKRMPDFARIHMSKPAGFHTLADIERYQATVVGLDKEGEIVVQNKDSMVKFFFKVPSLDDHINLGSEWAERINMFVDKTIANTTYRTERQRLTERNNALNEYALTLNVLKHVNWVSHIVISEPGEPDRHIDNLATIKDSMEIFSRMEGFQMNFDKAVSRFKERSTIALAGKSNFECPKCHSGQVPPGAKHPNLIPLNMVSYFFTVMMWRSRTRHLVTI